MEGLRRDKLVLEGANFGGVGDKVGTAFPSDHRGVAAFLKLLS